MALADPALAHVVIAMDGTAGAGKSSTSRAVARTLGLRYLDTGAMYRAVTLAVLRSEASPGDADSVLAQARRASIRSLTDPSAPAVHLDGEDVSREVRSSAVTAAVSQVSAIPQVRELMVALQRHEISDGGIVVEGRDIGTVVLPDADLKIYLTAEPSARARRRAVQLAAGHDHDLATVEADLARRDKADSTRVVSPLSAAADAVIVDSTRLSREEVVDLVVGLIRERLAVRSGG